MIDTVLYSYLLGWLVTSIGLALIAGKLADPVLPQTQPLPLVVAAGAAWPLVVLGVAQMAAVALVVNVVRNRGGRGRSIPGHSSSFTDTELDALLAEWPKAAGADAHSRISH